MSYVPSLEISDGNILNIVIIVIDLCHYVCMYITNLKMKTT